MHYNSSSAQPYITIMIIGSTLPTPHQVNATTRPSTAAAIKWKSKKDFLWFFPREVLKMMDMVPTGLVGVQPFSYSIYKWGMGVLQGMFFLLPFDLKGHYLIWSTIFIFSLSSLSANSAAVQNTKNIWSYHINLSQKFHYVLRISWLPKITQNGFCIQHLCMNLSFQEKKNSL